MATPRGPTLPLAACDPAMGTHTAVLLSAPPPPPTAYPLGHLMLGSSLRNQGRYLWNCSTDGRAEPDVGLTQVFKQARESTKRVGGSRQQQPPKARQTMPCPTLCSFPIRIPMHSHCCNKHGYCGEICVCLYRWEECPSHIWKLLVPSSRGGSKVQGRETASTGPPHSTYKRSC